MDENDAIQLLKKHASSDTDYEGVLEHCRAVQKLALEVAEKIKSLHPELSVDVEFIRTAAILHDIGRFRYPPGKDSIKHGVAGAEILRAEGVDDRYALVCERHLGAGITASDVRKQGLPIPVHDYVPLSIEEKIITYADNRLWGDTPKDSLVVVKRFTDELGDAVGQKVKKLHDEIEALME
ncbi:HDIG domain-containing metalloprotein [Nanoarchaeota archaeon]